MADTIPQVHGLETPNSALKAVRKAAMSLGFDYVYQRPEGSKICRYVHTVNGNQVPGCLIGRVLVDHGVPIEFLAGRDAQAEDNPTGEDVSLTSLLVNMGVSHQVANILRMIQRAQDDGSSWGEAIRQGKTYAAECEQYDD